MRLENLELVHFQLTRNCNLRCWFCGQWGKKGFFRDAAGSAMQLPDWLRIAEELKSGCEALPSILLWGGEPLLYPDFDALVSSLYQMGFPLGMVTNGTLLDRHLDACRSCFRHIYVSVDGTQSVHDAIRGAGITMPVDVGIMPILDQAATINMALSRNGCVMPRELCEIISKNWIFPNPFVKDPFDANVEEKKASFKEAGIEYTIRQIDEYRACGIDGIHLYALNKYDDVARIVKESGIVDLI